MIKICLKETVLKVEREPLVLTVCGRAFHILGAEQEMNFHRAQLLSLEHIINH